MMKIDNTRIQSLVDSAISESELAALTNKDTDTRIYNIDNAIRFLTYAKEQLEETKKRGNNNENS